MIEYLRRRNVPGVLGEWYRVTGDVYEAYIFHHDNGGAYLHCSYKDMFRLTHDGDLVGGSKGFPPKYFPGLLSAQLAALEFCGLSTTTVVNQGE